MSPFNISVSIFRILKYDDKLFYLKVIISKHVTAHDWNYIVSLPSSIKVLLRLHSAVFRYNVREPATIQENVVLSRDEGASRCQVSISRYTRSLLYQVMQHRRPWIYFISCSLAVSHLKFLLSWIYLRNNFHTDSDTGRKG